jgi:ATP-dependent helicase Lhr and Lhr-like helicase
MTVTLYKLNTKKRLDSLKYADLSNANKKLILSFANYCFSEGLSEHRVLKYAFMLKKIAKHVFSFEEVFEIAKKEQLYKILIFCNSRKKVEDTAIILKDILNKSKIVVHHGSLSKSEREETENFMKIPKFAVCVSTMTLEIGIDIGSLDAVVLADVPHEIESCIQRIGRAGRRTGTTRVFLLCNSTESKQYFEYMIGCAKENVLKEKIYYPDLSVVVQQMLSLSYSSSNGISEDYLYDLFTDFCSYEELKRIMEHLIESKYLINKDQKIYASEKIMNIGDRGFIHSNIPTLKAFEVINNVTNKKVGEIQLPIDFIGNYRSFVLAGKSWNLLKQKEGKLYVKESPMRAKSANFETAVQLGAFFKYLPEEIQGAELEKRFMLR